MSLLNYWYDHILALISSYNIQGVLPIQAIKSDLPHASYTVSPLAL